ncbi:MAG: M16 family metallopeptidase [Roseinatronobacter sp.]
MIRALFLAANLVLPLSAKAEIDITPVTTPSGLTAWLVQEPSIPFVAIDLVFVGGSVLDAPDKLGATNLMTALLEEGAGDMDAQAFATRSEELAARLGFDSGRDTITVSARFLTEDADAVIDHLRLALTQPRFDADAIERVRGQMQAQLRRDALNPNSMASRAFAAAAFGDHPYGRPTDGTPETVAALTRYDLIAAHEAAITRDRVFIGAAGDIAPDALAALLDKLFDGIPVATAPLPERVAFQAAPGEQVIDFDNPQSVVAFGHRGIPRDHPDFMAAFVLQEVFGGGRFGTRLMTSLREERGLTYGVGTGLASGTYGDSFQGRVSTDNANVPQVIELLRAEWARVTESGLTADELTRVQTYLTGAYPLRFDGNGSIASILSSMQFQGFDIDYVNRRNDLVRALTLDDVNRVARDLFHPDELVFIIVGRPVGLN